MNILYMINDFPDLEVGAHVEGGGQDCQGDEGVGVQDHEQWGSDDHNYHTDHHHHHHSYSYL